MKINAANKLVAGPAANIRSLSFRGRQTIPRLQALQMLQEAMVQVVIVRMTLSSFQALACKP